MIQVFVPRPYTKFEVGRPSRFEDLRVYCRKSAAPCDLVVTRYDPDRKVVYKGVHAVP